MSNRFHIRDIHKFRSHMPQTMSLSRINAHVFSRLDQCNSILIHITSEISANCQLLKILQTLENSIETYKDNRSVWWPVSWLIWYRLLSSASPQEEPSLSWSQAAPHSHLLSQSGHQQTPVGTGTGCWHLAPVQQTSRSRTGRIHHHP